MCIIVTSQAYFQILGLKLKCVILNTVYELDPFVSMTIISIFKVRR
jgi:hypothetical protein